MQLLRTDNGILSNPLRALIVLAALIDLTVGAIWLLAPEIGLPAFLWPSSVPPVLMRFVGAIIIGNGVGAALVARWGDWRSARALFAVAIVYGLIVFIALFYHLLNGTASPLFWSYVIVDAIFLFPLGYIYWQNEKESK